MLNPFIFIHDLLTRRKMERVFRKKVDPYRYATSPYEKDRFDKTIAALKGRRFASVLEVGCGEGLLTRHLLGIADRVTALDISSVCLDRCRAACGDAGGRLTLVLANAREWLAAAPAGAFDLIVLSDVLYYLGDGRSKGPMWEKPFQEFLDHVIRALAPGGVALLAHAFGNADEREIRAGYGRRLLEKGLVAAETTVAGDFAHDKGGLRCLVERLEKPGAPAAVR